MDPGETIRRRNRLKKHFTVTSNVLIFGYVGKLTDAEKLTYQAIDSFDWPDADGERKGYAYPSIATLGRLRGVSDRTIQRHLERLEAAGLLTREARPGQPNYLWIEEPSTEEAARYLSTIESRGDTDVTPSPDTDVTSYKKEEREEDKPVNESQRLWNKNRTPRSQLERAKNEWMANHMANELGDPQSLRFFRKVASRVSEQRIFAALSEVRQAVQEGDVRHTRGAMFVHLIRGALQEAGS